MTLTPLLEDKRGELEKKFDPRAKRLHGENRRERRGTPNNPEAEMTFLDQCAPLLVGYAAALVLAIIAGVGMRQAGPRRVTMGMFGGFAVVFLLLQVAIGLPLECGFNRGLASQGKDQASMRDMKDFAEFMDDTPAEITKVAGLLPEIHYTGWFWFSLAALSLGLLALYMERVLKVAPYSRRSTYG